MAPEQMPHGPASLSAIVTRIDAIPYFYYRRTLSRASNAGQVARFSDMFSALETEPRLRIMQLLLSPHPEGLFVHKIREELGIPASATLIFRLRIPKTPSHVKSGGFVSELGIKFHAHPTNVLNAVSITNVI